MAKKITKRLAALLSFVLVLSMAVMPVQAATVQPYAWPGRPGGNGDGSEEWLQGSYGEKNGDYKKIYTKKGKVVDLIKRQQIADVIGTETISYLAKGIPAGYIGLAVSGLISAGTITGAIRSTVYEGEYYTTTTAVSGRRMRILTKTYSDEGRKILVKKYKKIIKW